MQARMARNRTIHCRCIFNAFASLCFQQWRHALQSRAAPSVPVPFRPSDLVWHCLTSLKQLYFNVLAQGRLVRNFRCQCNECQLGLEVVEVMTERYQLVPNWHSGFSATPRPDGNGWLGGATCPCQIKMSWKDPIGSNRIHRLHRMALKCRRSIRDAHHLAGSKRLASAFEERSLPDGHSFNMQSP